MHERGAGKLDQLVAALVEGLPAQQRRLDEDHERRLAAFLPVLRAAVEGGHQDLAKSLVPAPQVLQRVEIQAGVRVSRSRGREKGIGVRLLNLGYQSRYAYSETAQSHLKLVVERVPMESPTVRD